MTSSLAGADGESPGFGVELRRRRLRAGLTLRTFAALVHYSESYLSRLETGQRLPRADVAKRLDDALGGTGDLVELATPQARPRPDRPDGVLGPPTGGPDLVTQDRIGPRDRSSPGEQGHHTTQDPHVDRLLRTGDACLAAGNMTAAGDHYLAAHRLARDPLDRAEAVARLARRWFDPGQLDHEVISLVNVALVALEGDDSPQAGWLRLRLLAHRAKKLSFGVSPAARPPGVAGGYADGAGVAPARRVLGELQDGDPDVVRCEVLTECRWALFDHESAADLLPLSLRLDEAARRAGDAHYEGEVLVALAVDLFRLGEVAAARSVVERHRAHAARSRTALAQWVQCTLDTMLDLWRGNFTGAREWIFGRSQEIVAGLEREMQAPADTLAQTRMGQVYWLLHEEGRLGELFTSGLVDDVQRHTFSPVWHAGLVLALAETGQERAAADQLLAFLEATRSLADLPPSGWSVPTLTLLAEGCAAVLAREGSDPDVAAAVPLIDARLAPHDGTVALAGWPTVLIGPVARARGLLALARGDGRAARAAFLRAYRPALTSPPTMARLRFDQARAALVEGAPGARQEAAGLLTDAADAADGLGMAPLAARARALHAEVAGPPSG